MTHINGLDYPGLAFPIDNRKNPNQLLAVAETQADSFVSSAKKSAVTGGLMAALAFLPQKLIPEALINKGIVPYLRGGLGIGAAYVLYKGWNNLRQLSSGLQSMVQDQLLRRMTFGPFGDPYHPGVKNSASSNASIASSHGPMSSPPAMPPSISGLREPPAMPILSP